jgi:3-methyladenine DNA glycosylase AlkD
VTPEHALAAIKAKAQNGKDLEMAAYHKVERPYLGTANPDIDFLVKKWRAKLTLEARLLLCQGLWDSNIHEGQIAAAKLLTQARIRPDDNGAWALISAWVEQLDAWAIADHVASAAQKRIIANPTRLDAVEDWTLSENMWVRRAALVVTLPYANCAILKSKKAL